MKTCWKDVDMRKVNPLFQVGNCADWLERLIGVPSGTIVFMRSNQTKANKRATLKSLQRRVR